MDIKQHGTFDEINPLHGDNGVEVQLSMFIGLGDVDRREFHPLNGNIVGQSLDIDIERIQVVQARSDRYMPPGRLILETEAPDNVGGNFYRRQRLHQDIRIEAGLDVDSELARIPIPKNRSLGRTTVHGTAHFLRPLFLPESRTLQFREFEPVVFPLDPPAQCLDLEALITHAVDGERTRQMVRQLLYRSGSKVNLQPGKMVEPQLGSGEQVKYPIRQETQ